MLKINNKYMQSCKEIKYIQNEETKQVLMGFYLN